MAIEFLSCLVCFGFFVIMGSCGWGMGACSIDWNMHHKHLGCFFLVLTTILTQIYNTTCIVYYHSLLKYNIHKELYDRFVLSNDKIKEFYEIK